MKELYRIKSKDSPPAGSAVVITDENRVIKGFALVEPGEDGDYRLVSPSGESVTLQVGWHLTLCRYNHEDGKFYPPGGDE